MPKDPDLVSNISRVEQEFPELAQHRVALSQLGSQVVYARLVWTPSAKPLASLLVRWFSGAIKSAFGLTREVMFFYAPYHDFQVRDYQVAQSYAKKMPREVTPDIVFISAPDPRLRTKLDDWVKPGLRAIPLERRDWEPLDFISLIRGYVYSRDLLFETSPVRGPNSSAEEPCFSHFRTTSSTGACQDSSDFGKPGKTSVLFQLTDNLKQLGLVVVLIDLEGFPSPPDDPIPDLLLDLRRRLVLALKAKSLPTR